MRQEAVRLFSSGDSDGCELVYNPDGTFCIRVLSKGSWQTVYPFGHETMTHLRRVFRMLESEHARDRMQPMDPRIVVEIQRAYVRPTKRLKKKLNNWKESGK